VWLVDVDRIWYSHRATRRAKSLVGRSRTDL
jgi:hypothetical protein